MSDLPLHHQFEVADGSVTGRSHLGRGKTLIGLNNQDALCWQVTEGAIVAVVCDGCGSGHFSEFGARYGANLFAQRLASISNRGYFDTQEGLKSALTNVWITLTAEIERLAWYMLGTNGCLRPGYHEGALSEMVQHHFLFTMVGAIITPTNTYVVSIGDGCYVVNGTFFALGPYEHNAPPYIAYAVTDQSMLDREQFDHFHIHINLPTSEIGSLLIGTDGVEDLVELEDKDIPGGGGKVGPLSQFWTQDVFFTNPAAIDRRLRVFNREVTKFNAVDNRVEKSSGLLRDDTSLVVIRRKA